MKLNWVKFSDTKYVADGYTVARQDTGEWTARTHFGNWARMYYIWYRDAQRACEEHAEEEFLEEVTQRLLK